MAFSVLLSLLRFLLKFNLNLNPFQQKRSQVYTCDSAQQESLITASPDA